MSFKPHISFEDGLAKLQKYCAYQDRCHQEVRTKLLKIGVRGDDLELIIVELIQEKFLDEERFARSYARGKFRIKRWGWQKIRQELKRRNISAYCIKKAFEEIEAEEYDATLEILLEKKSALLVESNPFKRYQKLYAFAYRKGYESAIIKEVLNRLLEK